MTPKRKINESQKPQSVDSDYSSNNSKPERAVNRERKEKLDDLINVVTETAEVKGWNAQVSAKDTKHYRYATVSVSRHNPNTVDEVTGTFEITCDEKIKITYHRTSFYGSGLSDLYAAICNEFWKLPWIKREKRWHRY